MMLRGMRRMARLISGNFKWALKCKHMLRIAGHDLILLLYPTTLTLLTTFLLLGKDEVFLIECSSAHVV
jgi:hypothetical protein